MKKLIHSITGDLVAIGEIYHLYEDQFGFIEQDYAFSATFTGYISNDQYIWQSWS